MLLHCKRELKAQNQHKPKSSLADDEDELDMPYYYEKL
jgi:hypothetical protein